MQFIFENWLVLLISIGSGTATAFGVFYLIKNGTATQLVKVQEWLIWAVTGAEKELGGGTGQLKLRQVYDLFLMRFPKLSKVISFEDFGSMVDDALEIMRKMLQSNAAVKKFVSGGDDNAEST